MLSRIQLLEPRVANQIAAGEVIERPSSIVKELLENSIDAKATRIVIDIEKGGMTKITVRDNGLGIVKEDLRLATTRHATSKIKTSEDLTKIMTLGFRGEALASISAVSHLTIQSNTKTTESGWQVMVEGSDLTPKVSPVAHAVGTTVEIRDLFYNLPARRNFLRSQKTEFLKIEDIVKKIALSHHDITIELNHNDRTILQVPGNTCGKNNQRISRICGKSFLDHAITVDFKATDLSLNGWLADPSYSRSASDLQFCFLNGRVIKDRVVNHAIRQAYDEAVLPGRFPCYVLYLTINPCSVDVNVHPTKHEVRFRESHLVHDFILYHLRSALNGIEPPKFEMQYRPQQPKVAEPEIKYHTEIPKSPIRILHVLDNQFVFYFHEKDFYCADLHQIMCDMISKIELQNNHLFIPKPLFFPLSLNIDPEKIAPYADILKTLGIMIEPQEERVLIQQLPELLQWINSNKFIYCMAALIDAKTNITKIDLYQAFIDMIKQNFFHIDKDNIIKLIMAREISDLEFQPKFTWQLTAEKLKNLLKIF